MRKTAIVGVGHARFGNRTDANLQELAWEAIKPALIDAGVTQKDVDFVALANAGGWSSEPLPAPLVAEYAGLNPTGSMRVEAACASGSAAVRVAATAVASGEADVALAVGVEKMTESIGPTVVEFIGRAGNYMWEFQNYGVTFPAYYAFYATAYLNKYGASEEDLDRVAVKNHYYGSMNPYAHFQKKITLEDCAKSRYVAWPLKLYHCCPQTDGAAAVVITSEEKARKLTDSPVWIRSQGTATGTSNLSKREDFVGIDIAVEAARQAYAKAGVDAHDPVKSFDVAIVHDCFTIAELMAYEDLGFAKRGEGFNLIREEQTHIGGKLPVNLDGGLKSKGHPIAATGVSMMVELTKQLQRRVENGRQADIKKGWAMAHNLGGTGHYAYVTILSLDKPS